MALTYPQIDPVMLSIGPLQLRWYGLMYVLGFLASYLLVKKQIRDFKYDSLAKRFDDLNLLLILSVVIGGRLGYVVFYNLPYYLEHPLEIPATWNGGMSFHGACIALIVGSWIFCRRKGLDYWKVADVYAATFPIGIGFGRLGNFINGELYGRTTDVPWGMIFPGAGNLPRHPSQIYEALLEGCILFLLLWSVHKKPWKGLKNWPHGSIFALFLIGYGIARIFAELFREPDSQVGFLLGHLTEGQILSCFMVFPGILLWGLRARNQKNQLQSSK